MVSTTAVLSTTSTPRDTYFRLEEVDGGTVEECVFDAAEGTGDFWIGRIKRGNRNISDNNCGRRKVRLRVVGHRFNTTCLLLKRLFSLGVGRWNKRKSK